MAINPLLFDWSNSGTAGGSATTVKQDFIGPTGPPPGWKPATTPQVLGTTTTAPAPKPAANTTPQPTQPAQPSGPSPEEIARQQEAARQAEIQRQLQEEANNLYNQRMGYISQVEQNVRDIQPGIEQNIMNTAAQNEALTRSQAEQAGRQIETTKEGAGKNLTNAINAARQTLNEAGIGYGQRFGEASNIAKALGEYGSTKFQQVSGQARDTYQNALASLNEQQVKLGENLSNALTSINNWRTQSVNEAQNAFKTKLLEISGMRTQAEEAKSQLRIQALQDLQAQINQAKTMALQYELQAKANASNYSQGIQSQLNNYLSSIGKETQNIGAKTAETLGNVDVTAAAPEVKPTLESSIGSIIPRLQSMFGKKPGDLTTDLTGSEISSMLQNTPTNISSLYL